MPESSMEVIRRCQRSPNKSLGEWSVLPGLTDEQIRVAETEFGHPFSEPLKTLLRETAGIKLAASPITFHYGSYELDLLRGFIHLMDDGCGNFWALDTKLDP